MVPKEFTAKPPVERHQDSTEPGTEHWLPGRSWAERGREAVTPDDFVDEVVVDALEQVATPPKKSRSLPGNHHLRPGQEARAVGWQEELLLKSFVKAPGTTFRMDEGDLQDPKPRPGATDVAAPQTPDGQEWAATTGNATVATANPAIEPRHLSAQAPESVLPGRRFAITALIRCGVGPGTASTGDLAGFQIPQTGREVAIDLSVQGGLRVESDATLRLTVLPGQDSPMARFELEATEEGPASILLRAFALPSDYLGQVRFDLTVRPEGTGVLRTLNAPTAEVAEQAGKTVTLEIDVEGTPVAPQLFFRLRGPGTIGVQRRETKVLTMPLSEFALGIERQLDQIAQTGTASDPGAMEDIFQTIGTELWRDLLPEPIQRLLVEHLDSIDSLLILGANDPVPWELLCTVVPGHGPQFLSDRMVISRWNFGVETAPLLLNATHPPCYVLPANAPPKARDEIASLKGILGEGKQIANLSELRAELVTPNFSVLHFAAHNVGAGAVPGSAAVRLDVPFQQNMFGPQYAGKLSARRPVVFLNACNSSAASPHWVGSTSWAGRFLDAGAGVFLGSLWQVRDEGACKFATVFYEQLKAGAQLGQAFLEARRSVLNPGDPTRLGYSLYGNPQARFKMAAIENA